MGPKRRRIFLAAILPVLCWSVVVIAFLPELAGWPGIVLACSWGALAARGLWLSRKASGWLPGIAAGGVLIALLYLVRSPSDSRSWIEGQERSVMVEVVDGVARIENLRHVRYDPDGEVLAREWYVDSFAIGEVERVDFVHEILSSNGLIAHGFLTFGFTDGRHLAVSVEARRRWGQRYHPVRGLFRNYELVYVLGQEVDLIGMRANVRQNPVYVYPIAATPEQVRELLQSVLTRADHLGREPEFYHTLTNNCVTNILLHVNEVTGKPVGRDLRILFPGGADDLIRELGWLDFEGSREEARRRFQINERSRPMVEPLDWSRQIRAAEPAGAVREH